MEPPCKISGVRIDIYSTTVRSRVDGINNSGRTVNVYRNLLVERLVWSASTATITRGTPYEMLHVYVCVPSK